MNKVKALIAILGLDQHELGAITVSRILADAGVEVVYAGRFNLPPMIADAAEQEDVNVIGLSCCSWEYLYYVPELLQLLQQRDLDIPVIVGGSVITPGDAEKLRDQGVTAVFGPSSAAEDIVEAVKSSTNR